MTASGAVYLVLPAGVVQLNPERAVFDGMLEGWWRQQRSWLSREATIKPRLALVRRFAEFTGLYPWQSRQVWPAFHPPADDVADPAGPRGLAGRRTAWPS
ncbi:hypothetical protein [Dactylosporangium darangshiense]|uniref:hypothetical protein n=1 Tax=Dactylosporangium darangshiense TaxID=579108 RepID=UPI0031EA5ED6